MSMQVRVLGAYGSALQEKRTCGFLIDSRLMIDGGTISSAACEVDLARIDDIVLSHAHLDHCKDVGFLCDLIFGLRETPLRCWGTAEVIADVQKHIFNNRIWPDFTRIPTADKPIIEFHVLPHRETVQVGPYRITAFPVNHPVPADGFLIDNGHEVLVYSGDTGETDELWAAAAAESRVAAVLVETSFPNALKGVADVSGHLVPAQLPAELGKLGNHAARVPIYAYHLKPQAEAEIMTEITALGMQNLRVSRQDEVIEVSLLRA